MLLFHDVKSSSTLRFSKWFSGLKYLNFQHFNRELMSLVVYSTFWFATTMVSFLFVLWCCFSCPMFSIHVILLKVHYNHLNMVAVN